MDESLHDALAAHGLTAPDQPEPGRLVRFPGAGKGPGNLAGWLRVFPDGQGAAFGDWSTGLSESWQARQPADEAERRRWSQELKQARQEAERQRKQAQQKAAANAADTFAQAKPADTLHGYLVAKGIPAHGIKQDGARLLIPLQNERGEITSIQTIDGQGAKRFTAGGKVKGSFHLIGQPDDVLVIAEGYATAASIHEATGHPVAVAFNAGNLEPVAVAMRARHPDARLILAADDDQKTAGNPGMTKARAAAEAVRGELVTPGQPGDFNDLHGTHGPEAIRARFAKPERLKGPPVFSLVKAGALKPRPMDWLINGLFESDSLLQLFGPPGGAKTFTVLDMAGCIAAGLDYHGRSVKAGAVVYIAGEGFNGLARRLLAWSIVNRQPLDDLPLFISTMPAAMMDFENLSTVMAAIDTTGEPPALVVLDTVARNFGPGDENSTADMGKFVAACDQIRAAYGCTVALVHHTGHTETQRGRGSSVLNGAIDAAYRITRPDGGPVLIENAKMKDAPPPDPLAFRFESVDLPFSNDDGTPATSAVLKPCDPPALAPPPAAGKHQEKALALLLSLHRKERAKLEKAGTDPERARVMLADWRQAAQAGGIPRNRFYDVKNALVDKGQIITDGLTVRPARHD